MYNIPVTVDKHIILYLVILMQIYVNTVVSREGRGNDQEGSEGGRREGGRDGGRGRGKGRKGRREGMRKGKI